MFCWPWIEFHILGNIFFFTYCHSHPIVSRARAETVANINWVTHICQTDEEILIYVFQECERIPL